MAATTSELATRIHADVLAPLVIGGALRPRRPVGPPAARALATLDADIQGELADRVTDARLARVRRLVPVSQIARTDPASWAIAAALHDFLLASHPGWQSKMSASGSSKLLASVDATLDGVAPPADVAEALARHAWFARFFDIRRNDTRVSWWIGEHVYEGEAPPARVAAWPRLRRVHVEKKARSLLDAVAGDDAGERGPERVRAIERLLRATPLTDLATCARTRPPFAWSRDTLALVATHAGRTLALRAMDLSPDPAAVDRALGRATRALLGASREALAIALAVLADRALADLSVSTAPFDAGDNSIAFARDAGALAAMRVLSAPTFPESERERLAPLLEARARRLAARERDLLRELSPSP